LLKIYISIQKHSPEHTLKFSNNKHHQLISGAQGRSIRDWHRGNNIYYIWWYSWCRNNGGEGIGYIFLCSLVFSARNRCPIRPNL